MFHQLTETEITQIRIVYLAVASSLLHSGSASAYTVPSRSSDVLVLRKITELVALLRPVCHYEL